MFEKTFFIKGAMTALDVWMVASLIFIIIAMLETTLVTWMYQNGDQKEAAVRYGILILLSSS